MEWGKRETGGQRSSSFSEQFQCVHSSLRDMRQLRMRSFYFTALFLTACTAASEHSDKQAATPVPDKQTPTVAVATREAGAAAAVAVSNGALATPAAPRAIAALRDPATTPVI